MKHGFIVVDGISFPTLQDGDLFMVEYPHRNIPKATEEEKKNFAKLSEFTSKFIKENKIEFIYGERKD